MANFPGRRQERRVRCHRCRSSLHGMMMIAIATMTSTATVTFAAVTPMTG
jgi:hypothetical protein